MQWHHSSVLLFAVDTLRNEPITFAAMVGLAVLAVALDASRTWDRDNVDKPPAEAA